MATFTSFSNILPDPVFKIGTAGNLDLSSGLPGPGFASVNFQSNEDVEVSRTISGRGIHRDQGSQHFSFSIKYNPMLREEFEPVEAFLAARNSRRDPFFVVLPQYSRPRDDTFNTFVNSNATRLVGSHLAGASSILIDAPAVIQGTPKSGDILNISDPANINHLKAYKVTWVETNALYKVGTTQPSTSQIRVHISPPLQKTSSDNSDIVWISPKFRVITRGNLREYELSTEGLYSYSLDLEEIQP